MQILSIIKQTNYKMIRENQFWLYTYTLMGIFNQYIISHWPKQTCQGWICSMPYKWLVQSSTIDKLFYFFLVHVSSSWFFYSLAVAFMKWLLLVDFIVLYIVQSCFKFQTSKLHFFNLCWLTNLLLYVCCNLLILEWTEISFNCILVCDIKILWISNKETKYFQINLFLTVHS